MYIFYKYTYVTLTKPLWQIRIAFKKEKKLFCLPPNYFGEFQISMKFNLFRTNLCVT